MKLYLISGLGADGRVFERLKLNADVIHIPWKMPLDNESLSSYVQRLSSKIDTSEDFCLGGLSFGGMCAQEMAKHLKPKKLILISTAKGRDEFPLFVRFAFKIGIYKLVPNIVYKRFAFSASRLMGVFGKNATVNFKLMVVGIDKQLFGWSIDKMANWGGAGDFPYFHVHGTADKLLPARCIKNATLIKGGGHLMVLNSPKEISDLINRYLES
ncbi:alpha/beta fold hydrolase [Owenweeksia hongkongensis]|uniref:alpha/beta fold hydrolase n=1 Tax=Owenweeksia hongkongensis TaxID=253245 RepID=UPI003A9562ED